MNARGKRDRRGGQSWTLSVLLHLAIGGAIFGAWYWFAHRPQAPVSLGIEGHVVSADALAQAPPAPASPPPPAPGPQPEAPPDVPAPEPQPQPEAPPTPTPEELAAAQAAAEARAAEEQRLADERAAADRKAAAEKAAREKAAKEKAAQEKAAKEKADREKAAQAERERQAREQAELEQAEQARQREDELASQLAAEERLAAARASGLQNQYIAQISAAVQRKWNKPPSATAGLDCEVKVTQVPGGAVTGVTIGHCNGDDAVRQSIQNAVLAASPLPQPPDPALFDRNLRFNFRPTK
ncbi:MAG TPA: cell envelope integrity protein TolA [Steroidobacteraceae bacterium]|nr:cell envelope integrity protein TolA [Steroidobacteraceae bacterium]